MSEASVLQLAREDALRLKSGAIQTKPAHQGFQSGYHSYSSNELSPCTSSNSSQEQPNTSLILHIASMFTLPNGCIA